MEGEPILQECVRALHEGDHAIPAVFPGLLGVRRVGIFENRSPQTHPVIVATNVGLTFLCCRGKPLHIPKLSIPTIRALPNRKFCIFSLFLSTGRS
jgi:hypothetical protein